VLLVRPFALILVDITMANFDVPVVGPLLASELFDKRYAAMFAECTEAAYDDLGGLFFGTFYVVDSQQDIDSPGLPLHRGRKSPHHRNDYPEEYT
jgi:hypothetical protein